MWATDETEAPIPSLSRPVHFRFPLRIAVPTFLAEPPFDIVQHPANVVWLPLDQNSSPRVDRFGRF
jgi:hypothetical protein